MKTKISEIKNMSNWINSKLDNAEQKFTEPEDTAIETTQNETTKDKRLRKMKSTLLHC